MMMKTPVLTTDSETLAKAWNEMLPKLLNPSDEATVLPDEKDPDALNIHISTAGRSKYSFDFRCTYMDQREVKVEVIDVERDGVHIDERNDIVQTLIEDHIRHIHECAQQLKELTKHDEG